MMRSDDALRRALEEIAQEETERFARSMTQEEKHQAEEAFRGHRRRVLSLIARKSKTGGRRGGYLRAAAALILLLGGALIFFRQSAPETQPLSPGASSTVAPFHAISPAPTETPAPTAKPTAMPTPMADQTISPTSAPDYLKINTQSPTVTPISTENPLPSPTPEATAVPENGLLNVEAPAGWQGAFFPGQMPAGYAFEGLESEEDAWSASFRCGEKRIVFTEYGRLSALPIPEGASVSYRQWNGAVALIAERNGGVRYTWDQDGHTLFLEADDGEIAEAVARTVKSVH